MTADELRELAGEIENGCHDSAVQAAAYLRACADALEKGPVAYKHVEEGLRQFYWADEDEDSCKECANCQALYHIAMPIAAENTLPEPVAETAEREHALRMPEPMTEAEVSALIEKAWDHFMGLPDTEKSMALWKVMIARAIEAETLRRVKEANE